MAQTTWQRNQYRRLLTLLDHAERNLDDEAKRRLGFRLIQLTAAVDALIRPQTKTSNHHHVAGLITELESKHLTY